MTVNADLTKQNYESYQKIFDRLILLNKKTYTKATLRGEVYEANGFHQKISQLIS